VLTQLMTAVTPQRMPNVAEEPGQGVRLFDTQAILNWLDPRGPSPRTIRGTITVTFAAETAGVTFDVHRDLRREKEAGGVRVTYQEQQDEEEDSRGRPGLGYTFSVTGQLSLLSGLTVKDAAGGTVPSEWRTWVYRKDHLVLTLHLPGNAETVTFWVVTKPVIRTYPFEFTAAPPPEED